jgi:putative hydrolase of HD superfamily
MAPHELQGCLDFLRECERMKNVLRSGHTSTGRPESTAEHTWRLCLMAMLFERELQGLDFGKLLKLCVVPLLSKTDYDVESSEGVVYW